MCAIQRKTGAGIVIELPQTPIIRVVTGTTFGTQTTLVWVIPGVAIAALSGSIGKFGREMARLARCHRVQANQWKGRQVMIETNIGLPRCLLVTTSTILTEGRFMNVICLVTGKTRHVQNHIGLTGRMAGLTVQAGVRTRKVEICVYLVIEAGIRPLLSVMA